MQSCQYLSSASSISKDISDEHALMGGNLGGQTWGNLATETWRRTESLPHDLGSGG
jgi:hypothetical protein